MQAMLCYSMAGNRLMGSGLEHQNNFLTRQKSFHSAQQGVWVDRKKI